MRIFLCEVMGLSKYIYAHLTGHSGVIFSNLERLRTYGYKCAAEAIELITDYGNKKIRSTKRDCLSSDHGFSGLVENIKLSTVDESKNNGSVSIF